MVNKPNFYVVWGLVAVCFLLAAGILWALIAYTPIWLLPSIVGVAMIALYSFIITRFLLDP